MSKRLLTLFLGGILTMTLLNGCVREDKNSEEAILSNFTDFIDMFPSEDLTYLYDKEGSGDLDKDDLGTWVVSSDVSYKEDGILKSYGCNLFFNRNLRQSRGNFIIMNIQEGKATVSEEYPIYYDKEGIHLLEEVNDEEILNKFNKFKMMFEYISLDKEYIKKLELERKYYNAEVPIYGLLYKLSSDDKNLSVIKELYPEFQVKEDEGKLKFHGHIDPTSTIGWGTITMSLDKERNAYIIASYGFQRSEKSIDLFKKE